MAELMAERSRSQVEAKSKPSRSQVEMNAAKVAERLVLSDVEVSRSPDYKDRLTYQTNGKQHPVSNGSARIRFY